MSQDIRNKDFWDGVYDSPAKMIAVAIICTCLFFSLLWISICIFNPKRAKAVREAVKIEKLERQNHVKH